jgi:hypothetical protein
MAPAVFFEIASRWRAPTPTPDALDSGKDFFVRVLSGLCLAWHGDIKPS